jgi:hypothetical protein
MGTNHVPIRFDVAESEPILTPSEVVYLAGEQFVTFSNFLPGTYHTPCGVHVPTVELAERAYAAAFLAADKAGTLHLEIHSHKVLFGLWNVEVLYADPVSGASLYPPASLESQLTLLAGQLYKTKGRNEVWRVVYNLFPTNSYDPYAMANDLIGWVLANRNLLEVSWTKNRMGFTEAEFRLPLRTEDLAASRVNEVRRLLHEYQENQQMEWDLLVKGINKGLRARKKETN